MIASLMMYERPELAEAHRQYWALIRRNLAQRGIDSPEQLSQDADALSVWRDPTLVLSQTCAMPYRTLLHPQVELIGTPNFALADCPAGYYRSAFVVRSADTRQSLNDYQHALFAYNDPMSQSGFAAAYWHLKPHGFWFKNTRQSQAHLASARAVAEGRADIACIDAVTWRLAQRFETFSSQLRVIDWTTPTPGLPYISAKGTDKPKVFAAINQAIDALLDDDRDLLGIVGLCDIAKDAYLKQRNPDL